MKEKISDEVRDILAHIKGWLSHEVRYVKLTLAEKLTIFIGTMLLISMAFILVLIVLGIISFCLVGVFEPLVGTTLAYLCVGGIFLLLAVVIFLLRQPLIYNPLAKMISKLLLENDKN